MRTITDPALALKAAARGVLDDVFAYEHNAETCPVYVGRQHQVPGSPPRGYARSIVRWLRGKGYTTKVMPHEELWELGGQEVNGCTIGWVPDSEQDKRYKVFLGDHLNGQAKIATLTHEAAHVALGHPVHSWAEAKRKIRAGALGQIDHGGQEAACDYGAAILLRLADHPAYRYRVARLAHNIGDLNEKSITDGVLVAQTLLPVIGQSLN